MNAKSIPTFGLVLQITFTLLFLLICSGCSKESESPNKPAATKVSKGQVFKMVGDRSVISIISSDELEIRQNGQNNVFKYTLEEGKLRVVITAFGASIAKYFTLTSEGLVDEDGGVYHNPDSYAKILSQINLNSQLLLAVERDDAIAIGELRSKGAAIESRDERGTALEIAVKGGLTNAASALLQNGADSNRRSGPDGETPLWVAIRKGDVGMVEILLKGGAMSALKQNDGITPLIFAAKFRGENFGPRRRPEHDRILSLLCAGSLDLNAQDNEGFTALGRSLWAGNLEATRILVNAGADRSIGKEKGRDAFTLAGSYEDRVDAIRTISEREELKAVGDRYASMVAGVWRDNESTLTYSSDGTKSVRYSNGAIFPGNWSISGDTIKFEDRRGQQRARIVELNETNWVLEINGSRWRATRVSKEEIERENAKTERVRQLLVGRWSDTGQSGVEYVISSDGTMEDLRYGSKGKWNLDGDIFTSGSGKRYRLISIDENSFEFKKLNDILGGNWKAKRIN